MQFFYTINGWAGQNAFVDDAMRGFYVVAIPLLATLLAALLVFRPARWISEDVRAARIAMATLAAGAACLLGLSLLNWFCAHLLDTPILSSRPFVTHRVNALLVEPNDNSFPSPETALIGVLLLSVWAAAPALAWPSLGFALLFCFARVFCGSNYPLDVLAGLLGGIALNMLSLSLCGVALQRVRRLPWKHHLEPLFGRMRGQTAVSSALIVSSLLVLWFGALDTAHTTKQLRAWWSRENLSSAQAANESPVTIKALTGMRARPIEYSKAGSVSSVSSSSESPHEGEGAGSNGGENPLSAAPIKTIPRLGVTALGGNLPLQARQLLRALQNAHLAHSLVSVDVAALRGDEHHDEGNEAHFAAVRFQVRGQGPQERRRVAQTARRVVQIAFALNPRLQNVDVVGVVLSDPSRDGVKYPVFSVGLVPVWTASVERRNIVLPNGPAWLNVPNVDAGSWLRARSRIYINPRVLPETALRLAGAPLFQSAASADNEAAKPSPSTMVSSASTPPKKAQLSTALHNVAPGSPVAPKTVAPKTAPRPSPVAVSSAKPAMTTPTPTHKPGTQQNGAITEPRRVSSSTRLAPQLSRPPSRSLSRPPVR